MYKDALGLIRPISTHKIAQGPIRTHEDQLESIKTNKDL